MTRKLGLEDLFKSPPEYLADSPHPVNSHSVQDTHIALMNMIHAMDWLSTQGYRIRGGYGSGLVATNGVEEIELYEDPDDGWYYEVDAP